MTTALIIGCCAAVCAGFVQGCTGFGGALVAAPALMLVFNPTHVVPAVILLSLVNTIVVAYDARRHVRFELVAPLALGGLAGLPLGIYVLKHGDPTLMKLGIGVFVMLFTVALLRGWRRPLENSFWVRLPVGAASTFLGGATSMGGPPVILFLANQGTPKDAFRGSIACYFFVMNIYAIALHVYMRTLTLDVAKYALAFAPLLLLGTYGGIRVAPRIPEEQFRRVVMIAVFAMGLLLAASSLYALTQTTAGPLGPADVSSR